MKKINLGKLIALGAGVLGVLTLLIPDTSDDERLRELAKEEAEKVLSKDED